MNYYTIEKSTTAEFIERKSKFICLLIPINDSDDVTAALLTSKQIYPGANHYCFAYVLRQKDSIAERYSDDGEPSGTAGLPILNLIKQKQLQNVMAIVVRFFGGTLLGTGGLVRTYTRVVQMALDSQQMVVMERSQRIIITMDYNYYGSFENQHKRLLNRLVNTIYAEQIKIDAWIASEQLFALSEGLCNLTGGTAKIEYLEEGYVPKKSI